MNTAPSIFNFRNTSPVRVVVGEDNEPWFVAMDVSAILGYSDTEAMTRRLDDDEKQNRQLVGFGNRGVSIINESGLYAAILGSIKPEAKVFKKWVTSEVLPTIRKTGQYHVNQPAMAPAFDPANLSRMDLLQIAVQAEQERLEAIAEIERQSATIEVIQPKADALDRLSAADGSICPTEAAKLLKIQPKKLFGFMSRKKWIYRRANGKAWLGYQDKIQAGYIEHEPYAYKKQDGTEGVRDAVKITAKGLAKLGILLNADNKNSAVL